MPTIRPAAVAGMFYPDNPVVLKQTLADLLAHPERPAGAFAEGTDRAACGLYLLGAGRCQRLCAVGALRGRIRRVVLLGPTHRVWVRGWRCPRRTVSPPAWRGALDREGMRRLAELPQVTRSAAAHQMEHSLEVQLPFCSRCWRFSVAAAGSGRGHRSRVADVLERVWAATRR